MRIDPIAFNEDELQAVVIALIDAKAHTCACGVLGTTIMSWLADHLQALALSTTAVQEWPDVIPFVLELMAGLVEESPLR